MSDEVVLRVVVPAFNEEEGIRATIDELQTVLDSMDVSSEIVVVNDGSTDNTRAEAEHTSARIIDQPENLGYGAALKAGIRAPGACEFVAIIDADRTYPADQLPKLLDLAQTHDMVVASRHESMGAVPLVRRPAKAILNGLANYLMQRNIPDLNSGLRVFRRSSLMQFLPLLPQGFSFTTTITLCMMYSDLRVVYTPITYSKRTGSSKIRPTHFFDFILLVLRVVTFFNPLRVFLPLGAIFFMLGTLKLIYDIFLLNLSESAIFFFLTSIIIWVLGLIADMISRLHLHPRAH